MPPAPAGAEHAAESAAKIDVAMDHDSIREAGSMLGTAAMIMLDETACTVRAMQVIARFYDHESCGQCSQCREGTEWLYQIFARLERGEGRAADIELLSSLANGMAPGKTICALSDAAAIPTHAIVKNFRAELEEHVRLGRCPLASPNEVRDLIEAEEAHA